MEEEVIRAVADEVRRFVECLSKFDEVAKHNFKFDTPDKVYLILADTAYSADGREILGEYERRGRFIVIKMRSMDTKVGRASMLGTLLHEYRHHIQVETGLERVRTVDELEYDATYFAREALPLKYKEVFGEEWWR